ncbi:restriction endonuclease subunit S [Crocinitomicaceae bacterium]|nr:restriction endonuclease subunit S [Crocinitomicaceae bacterium]
MVKVYTIQELLKNNTIIVQKDGNFGGMYPRKEEFGDAGIPFLSAKHIDEDGNFNYTDVPLLNHKKAEQLTFGWIEDKDVLLSHNASVGKVGLYNGHYPKALIGTSLTCYRVNQELLDPHFLAYVFVSPNFQGQLKQNMGQTTRNQVPITVQKNLKIPLPPLDQQKKIAAILDEADEYRQKTKALIAKYDELTQSLFLDMFGDPVTNPKEWEYRKLSDLVSKLGDGIHGTPQYSEEGEYYFVNGNNLHQGKIFIDEKTKKVSEEEFLKHKKELNSNTVLVSINGTIGKVAFYNDEPIMLGKSACYFNLIEGVISKTYIYYVIYSPYFLRYAGNQATGSTIKNVSLKSMRNFPIPYPPLDLQNQFTERVQAIEEQKAQAQEGLAKAEDLFNSLLQKAFKGGLV